VENFMVGDKCDVDLEIRNECEQLGQHSLWEVMKVKRRGRSTCRTEESHDQIEGAYILALAKNICPSCQKGADRRRTDAAARLRRCASLVYCADGTRSHCAACAQLNAKTSKRYHE
jgi:hypothetical protein